MTFDYQSSEAALEEAGEFLENTEEELYDVLEEDPEIDRGEGIIADGGDVNYEKEAKLANALLAVGGLGVSYNELVQELSQQYAMHAGVGDELTIGLAAGAAFAYGLNNLVNKYTED